MQITREERCVLAIEKGYTYDEISGKVFNSKGLQISSKNNKGYLRMFLGYEKKRYTLLLHQFAWYFKNKICVEMIDHKNHIRDDNRFLNLRAVTNQENQFNQKEVNGYCWHKRNKKWMASIRVEGKVKFIGYYQNESEANTAYLEAKEKYHQINIYAE